MLGNGLKTLIYSFEAWFMFSAKTSAFSAVSFSLNRGSLKEVAEFYNLLTTLLTPFTNFETLKLISKPSLQFDNLK